MQQFLGTLLCGILLIPITYKYNIVNDNILSRQSIKVEKLKKYNRNFYNDTCHKNIRENIDTNLYIHLEIPCEMDKSGKTRKNNVIARYGKQLDDDTFIAVEISNSSYLLVNTEEGVNKAINFFLKKENLNDLGNVISVTRIKIKNIDGVKILHTADVKSEVGTLYHKYISYYLFPKGKYLIVKYYAGSKIEIKRDINFKKWENKFETMAKRITITK